MNLKGKSAIVTAAASGVGKTIAELPARQGVSVACRFNGPPGQKPEAKPAKPAEAPKRDGDQPPAAS